MIYSGKPLEREPLWALGDMVSVLLGLRVSHRSTETFGRDGRITIDFHSTNPALGQGEAAIAIGPYTTTTNLVSMQFGSMLDGMLALRLKDPRRLSAALHHYFEAVNHNFAVTRILMLSVAIDTLVALMIGQQGDKLIIEDDAIATKIFPCVKDAMRAVLDAVRITGFKRDQLLGRMERLNEMSGRQRQAAFWSSVNISLTTEERKVLELRNKVVHEGFIGSESTDEEIWRHRHFSQILANLFNRSLLRLLGWTGPYRDATYFADVEKPIDEGITSLDPPNTLDDDE